MGLLNLYLKVWSDFPAMSFFVIFMGILINRAAHEQDGEALPMGLGVDMLSTQNPDEADDEEADTPIYEKYDALLHGSLRSKK